MVIKVDTTPADIKHFLKEEVHEFRYNLLSRQEPLSVRRHSSGFGKFMQVWSENKLVASLKCESQMESFVVAKNLVEETLRQMGYVVEDSAAVDID